MDSINVLDGLRDFVASPYHIARAIKAYADKSEMEIALYMMTVEREAKKARQVEAIMTRKGPVRISEIPRTDDGDIDEDWMADNCICTPHTERREQPAEPEDRRDGLYL